MPNLDFIAIGDITTDAFIRLKDAEVHCDINREKCTLCMDFATKIPYEFVKVVPAVGNSANAAVSAARLGLKVGLVANMGDDQNGKECLAQLKKERVSCDYIKIHPGFPTNYHYVLWYEDERTILIKHEAYKYELPFMGLPKWIYLSSLGENGAPLHSALLEYLKERPEIQLAFQPGTFQISLGYEKLKEIYARTKVFFCNTREAQKILRTEETNIPRLLSKIKELGPEIAIITDGKKGAYLYYEKEMFFMPSYPDQSPPYERTGAGDAFASTFVAALALSKTPLEAITWAPVNSMSVVQYIGAQEGLLTRKKLEENLKNAPDGFKPEIII
ncbi:MAG: carbohydrate kinase family protein, partial [Patescibacteria group bacterium]